MTKRIDKIINPLYEWSANFSQNICKELVHKSFNSEVFLTDSYKSLMDILPNIQLDKTKQIQWDNGIILHRPQSIPIIKS